MLTASQILGPGGRIAARLPNYEHRPEQLAMAVEVEKTLAGGGHLIVEAGTGVGKSFAYLAPAILAATENEERANKDEEEGPRRRIIISTHTISLQEQLLTKDVPLLRSVIPREFTAVLVKGRGNYLSLRRLESAVSRATSLFTADEDLRQLRDVVAWSKDSGDGSLSDLGFQPSSAIWDEVTSDSSNCLGRKCPRYGDCFYYRARRRVFNAQILVVNHALFFSDLALRRAGVSILPDYDAVVMDEAHTLEAVAGDHLGLGITSGQVQYTLQKLYNDRTNKGLLVQRHFRAAQQMVLDCHAAAAEFFDDVYAATSRPGSRNGRIMQPGLVENTLSPVFIKLVKELRRCGESITDESEKQDYVAAAERLNALAGMVDQWVLHSTAEDVYWVEIGRTRYGNQKVSLQSAPIDVGPVLRAELFEKTKSVILTSATLAAGAGNSFDFFQGRVGLTKCTQVRVGSPFNYRENARIILVGGLPDPGLNKDAFDRAAVTEIKRYVEQTDGRAFVLFTSYDALKKAASALTPWLIERKMELYSQADGVPRTQLVERFKANPRGVLLGTDSFWQGVDVPGDALQNVIIPKLPFSVPDQPLLAARLDAIREAGGNPFRDYQLPEAVIKLRQGFGRLIRTQQDRGIVVLLDPRMKTKPYGRTFLQALPDCEVVEERAVGAM